MDTAGFYHQGTSVTHSLAESPFQMPPNVHPAHRHAASLSSQYGQQLVGRAAHSDLSSMNHKLDRVLAVVLEQKENVRSCISMIVRIYSFPSVAKQERVIASMKEQLNTVACEIEQMKDLSSSASEGKVTKQAIPCEISVSLHTSQ